MARIAGVTIPADKRVVVSLTYIYGIGDSASKKILLELKINPDTRVKKLTEDEVNRLRRMVEDSYRVEGNRRREVLTHIKRLKEIGCFRGVRHTRHLPVRGQRTKTNNRTVRGNVRRTMGSGKAQSTQKT